MLLLIPVVLLIGGIRRPVRYLEKDLHPTERKRSAAFREMNRSRRVAATADRLQQRFARGEALTVRRRDQNDLMPRVRRHDLR